MKLILPKELFLIRAAFPDGSKGLWHLRVVQSLGPLAYCGKYCAGDWEDSTLENATGDMCERCWHWSYENEM